MELNEALHRLRLYVGRRRQEQLEIQQRLQLRNGSHGRILSDTSDVAPINTETVFRGMQVKEALQLQLELQRRIHEQLEIQRSLQPRTEEEEEGKKLNSMFV